MPVDVVTEALIGRPLAEVAAFAADPDNAIRWYDAIVEIEWHTERPAAVGSRVAFVARFLGKRMVYTYEITAWEPEARMVMRAVDGPFPMETIYTWEAVDAGTTRMCLRNRGEPTGFSSVATPLLGPIMRRNNTKDLANLRAILEGEAPS